MFIFNIGDEVTSLRIDNYNYAFPPIEDADMVEEVIRRLTVGQRYCFYVSTEQVSRHIKDLDDVMYLPGYKPVEGLIINSKFISRVSIELIEKAGYGENGYGA